MQVWKRAGVGALALASVIVTLIGCGGDDSGDGPVGRLPLADIRAGTWMVSETLTDYTGGAGCDTLADTTVTVVDTLCSLSLVDVEEILGPGSIECSEFTLEGEQLTFDCSVIIDLDPCIWRAVLRGTGTVTDTTYDLDAESFAFIEAKGNNSEVELFCQGTYGQFETPCTTRVLATGIWLSAEGEEVCPGFDSTAVTVSVPGEVLLQRHSQVLLRRLLGAAAVN